MLYYTTLKSTFLHFIPQYPLSLLHKYERTLSPTEALTLFMRLLAAILLGWDTCKGRKECKRERERAQRRGFE